MCVRCGTGTIAMCTDPGRHASEIHRDIADDDHMQRDWAVVRAELNTVVHLTPEGIRAAEHLISDLEYILAHQ